MVTVNQHQPIVITGASGFIGKKLVGQLARDGQSLITTARSAEAVSPEHVSGDLFELLMANSRLDQLAKKLAPNACVHLAGIASQQQCLEDADLARRLNVDLVENVFHWCAARGIKTLVFASTGLVYGDQSKTPVDEFAPLRPANEYAKLKLAAENRLRSLVENTAMRVVVARLGNVYGPGSSANTVINRIVRQIKARQAPQVHSLAPVRDFIFIEDVARGLSKLVTSEHEPGYHVYNLATAKGYSIADVVNTAIEESGDHYPRAISLGNDDSSLVLNISRLEEKTGWRPVTDLAQGLRLMIKS